MVSISGNCAAPFVAIMLILCVRAQAQQMAVVPHHIIYPGQVVQFGSIKIVDATICYNCDAGYLQDPADVTGKIAVKTLVPGKLIFPSDLRKAPMVIRGQEVKVTYRKGALQISMLATPLTDAAVGDPVSMRNNVNGSIVTGVVSPDGTVMVPN